METFLRVSSFRENSVVKPAPQDDDTELLPP